MSVVFTRVNECETGEHDCNNATNHICVDHFIGFSCGCADGYYGNEIRCINIDECEDELHKCHNYAHCNDTEGSYECICKDTSIGDGDYCDCKEGYRGNGIECVNINECKDELHKCHIDGDCYDTVGSYECYGKELVVKNVVYVNFLKITISLRYSL